MKLWKKIAISLGALLLVIPLVIGGIFIYTTGDICGNEIYSKALSPNGKYKAVVFQRDCGATTGFSTQISIVSSSDELKNKSGNIYIIDGHPKDVLPILTWPSSTELRIEKSLSGPEYKAESNWGSLNKIKITYDTSNS